LTEKKSDKEPTEQYIDSYEIKFYIMKHHSKTTGDLVAVISVLASLGVMPVTMALAVSLLRVSALICIHPVMPVVMRILIWAVTGFSFVATILLPRRYFARFLTSSPLTMTIIMSPALPLTAVLPGNG